MLLLVLVLVLMLLLVFKSFVILMQILVLVVFIVGKARCAQGRSRQGWALVTYSAAARGIQFANCLRQIVTNDDE